MADAGKLPTSQKLLVLDLETPWIASLINELPSNWSPARLGTRTAGASPWKVIKAIRAGFVPIPGWTRAFRLSTLLFSRAVAKHISRNGRPRAIVHTIPWTAGLIDSFTNIPHVYRPHDYFGMYSWDQDRVIELERTMMQRGVLALPVSQAHERDLSTYGKAPAITLVNGVSSKFIEQFRLPAPARPTDLPSGFVVGCVGQINSSYDWELVSELVNNFPMVRFVFIGPIFDEPPARMAIIKEILARNNVNWLGPKPHDQLPNYIRHFDVCLSPLRVSPANDRRSLLRLYDYLASEKPVLSTAIASALEHRPHVHCAENSTALVYVLEEVVKGRCPVDVGCRRAYVDQQSWAQRGREFINLIEHYCPLN